MLTSCPVRAHLPIVPDVKWTLCAASNSAASERVIQSVGGLDIGQSPSFGFLGAEDAASSELESEPLDPPDLSACLAGRLEARSLRAQPEPLKCTAGGAKAFFIGEPQSGQADGPCPWTECMTSTV
jgi:hypothetical protein